MKRVVMMRKGQRSMSSGSLRVWSSPHFFPLPSSDEDGRPVVIDGIEMEDGLAVSADMFERLQEAKEAEPSGWECVELLDSPPRPKWKLDPLPPPELPETDDFRWRL